MKIFLQAATIFYGLFIAINPTFAQTWTQTSGSNSRWCSLACSADGTKLVAATQSYGLIYASTNLGSTWFLTGAATDYWTSVASSADGVKLVATAALIANPAFGGAHGVPIYTSTDSGTTWLPTSAPSNQWSCVASSADGSKLVAVAAYNNSNTDYGLIFISTNSGASWNASSAPTNYWLSIASSADGTILVAGATGGIFISTNSGTAWVSNSISADYPSGALPVWVSVASSADGAILIGIRNLYNSGDGNGPRVYTSTNYGSTWTSNNLPDIGTGFVASSADGSRLMASMGHIYISTNSGATWMQNNIPGQMYGWGSGCVASSADGKKLFLALGSDDFAHPNSIYTCYSPPTPQLNLKPSDTNLAFSWLVPSTNFALQQNLDLTTTNWVTLTNTPTLNLTNLQDEIILSPSNSSGFFRLIAQ